MTPGPADHLTPERERIIEEYTHSLRRKLRENASKVPPEIFGSDGHVIRWLGQQITRDDSPPVQRAGRRITGDLLYYELSL